MSDLPAPAGDGPEAAEDPGARLSLDAGRQIAFGEGQAPSAMLDDLLSVAIRRGATDVHIERYAGEAALRFRIDTVMQPVPSPLSPNSATRVVSRIKVLCDLDLMEHRVAQDGHMTAFYGEEGGGRRIELRATICPGPHGEDAVIRILDPSRFILELERLEMGKALRRGVKRLLRYPHGLLLTTGPTASGKTTTLYASIQFLRELGGKIVTVEDPIEYEFPRVNQKNVSAQMGFAEHVRSFLRQNPDVIVIGEIRDPETAEVAVRAATTGHLVLSSLHTGDAIGAVGRLRTLGIPDDLLSEVLIGALGQRLVRRICRACREEAAPAETLVPLYFEGVPAGPFFHGRGCPECHGTGYRGLVGIFELFRLDPALSGEIGGGADVETLRRKALERGHQPLIEDALHKVREGLTTLEEIGRRIAPKFPNVP